MGSTKEKKKKVYRLNVQGLARRDKGLMSCILDQPGHTTVSIDLSAGEPTVTAHFTGDANYKYATFDGVGKAPHYVDSLLMVDDVYIMTASQSPIGSEKIKDAFYNKKFGGRTFAEQWLVDSEVVKSALKETRTVHKILALALSYGMGPKKMVTSMYEKGYHLSFKDAKLFYDIYWNNTFPGIKRFSETMTARVMHAGYVVNPFGYRLTPEPRNAFNAFIQSSVSGIMHVYTIKLFTAAPWARFITCIHDELLVSVPTERLEEFKHLRQLACDSLNDDLRWTTKVRVGWATGLNWYDAK